eukprot:g11102.t1
MQKSVQNLRCVKPSVVSLLFFSSPTLPHKGEDQRGRFRCDDDNESVINRRSVTGLWHCQREGNRGSSDVCVTVDCSRVTLDLTLACDCDDENESCVATPQLRVRRKLLATHVSCPT